MATSEAICQHCGETFRARRVDARFCGARCQKASRRCDEDASTQGRRTMIWNLLRHTKLVARVWPVYTWDDTPTVLALMVPRRHAVLELNMLHDEAPIADGELAGILNERQVAQGHVEARLVKEFYASRKDRRRAA